MEALTLASLLESITTVVTSGVTWMTSVLTAVGSNPILLLEVVALPLVGVGIGLFKRVKGS